MGLIIYIILSIIWAIYATYKTSKMGILGKLTSNLIKTFVVNLILFPFCLTYALYYKNFK